MAASAVFSEYELRRMAIKFANEQAATEASCVGSVSYTHLTTKPGALARDKKIKKVGGENLEKNQSTD